ncbi:MAG: hypothetical protein MJK18_04905, partial [Bdellovibrionales bacterium]|nr:hypothetical protein [Bdellovibrionales bacterium]
MGIKQTDVQSFLKPESVGFVYDTARAFLKRHSSPEMLRGQLQNLLNRGEIDSCKDLIQLIIEEQHPLSGDERLFLMRAKIAFEQSDKESEYKDWIQQAKLCNSESELVKSWERLGEAQLALKEGDYQAGTVTLHNLLDDDMVGDLASYVLAHHLFWKSVDTNKALNILEELVENKPHFVKAWACLGFVYNKLQFKDKAQYAFGQCIEF